MRTALITGASRGIGAAIADVYGATGYRVIAPRRAELDLADGTSLARFIEQLDEPVDVLINNAGDNVIREIGSIDDAEWATLVDLNLSAPLRLMRGLAPRMAERRWGRIVNVASIYGLVSRAGRGMYSATKSGLIGLTRTAAIEFGPSGVLVNAVCPGFVDTELTRRNNSAEQIAVLESRVPLRRLAQPEEIASFILYLGSEANTYVSGQAIVIDGGLLAQ